MRWDRNYTSSNIEDRRGWSAGRRGGYSGSGAGIFALIRVFSLFGWKGTLVGLVVAAVLAGGGTCVGGSGLGCPADPQSRSARPVSTAEEDELVRFVGYVLDDIQEMWRVRLDGYRTAKLVLFRRGVRSACGTASTAIGPFYCPLDGKVYLDLSFFAELRRRFGAPGDFAQAYVIAHEIGHHVQNLRGKLSKSERSVDQIAVELQADCLAGAWAHDAERRGRLEVGDVDEALTAAAAIGDDTLQRKTQGHVQPETWTHGSSAQRRGAFDKGYQRGPEACGIY